MGKKVFTGTFRRMVIYTVIIVLLFSSIILFQTFYSVIDRQRDTADNMYPYIKSEIDKRKISLYSNFSSNILNAQKNLFDAVSKVSTLNNMSVFIFDINGNVLTYAPNMEAYKSISTTTVLQRVTSSIEYKSLFESKKRLFILGDKTFKKALSDYDVIGRTYIYIDEYQVSKTDPEQTVKIAVCVSSYSDTEKVMFKNNAMLVSIPVIIFSAISITMIAIFASSVSKPLNEFLSLARSVEKGDLKFRVQHKQDSSEMGELSKTFNSMMEKLEKTEIQREEFASNVAHELRTPMTAIGGFVEGILDGTISQDKHEYYLHRVSDEIKRLTNMVRDLLVLTKIDADDSPLVKNRFDINDLIRKSVLGFENDIVHKKIYINVNFPDENTYVYANPDDIERVLINLLHNAIKFTNEGGNINIAVEHKRNKVYVYIRDNGMGIDYDELQNIWTRFYKSDKSRGRDKTGTGLGLSIVYSVIKRHDEMIDVKSQKGMGTEFTFTLESAEQSEN